jgi:DNA helicase-2/ATP-dependent DNA helicase PcrA
MLKKSVIEELNLVRKELRSERRRVVVEAPAGCGKTYEAVALACEVAVDLNEPERVLLLTHTHAAKDEFGRRAATANGSNKVRISTLDAFLVELCLPHTAALNLPAELTGGIASGEISFQQIAKAARELLGRSQVIAQVIGRKFPMILLDEHQDASRDQHDAINLIVDASESRVRIFGDPMQAIYELDSGIEWTDVLSDADSHCLLEKPWRWSANPSLGDWVRQARENLASLEPLPAIPKDAQIQLIIVPAVADPGYSTHFDERLIKPLRAAAGSSDLAVLTYKNRHADSLASRMGGLLDLNEGSDFGLARSILRDIISAKDSPKAIATIIVRTLSKVGVGFDSAKCKQCLEALRETKITTGNKKQVLPLLASLERIYKGPSVNAACIALREIVESPPSWLKRWRRPRNLAALGFVSDSEADPVEALEAIIAQHRDWAKPIRRMASTIHKAKGLEFGSVILWNFSSEDFAKEEECARLLYVAISRPTRNLCLIVPGSSPSAFLPS